MLRSGIIPEAVILLGDNTSSQEIFDEKYLTPQGTDLHKIGMLKNLKTTDITSNAVPINTNVIRKGFIRHHRGAKEDNYS